MTTTEATHRTLAGFRDLALVTAGSLLQIVVCTAGWSASFIGLHAYGQQHMGFSAPQAWLVPMTFDGAPIGLSVVVLAMSLRGESAGLSRLMIVAFTALSSWINWQHIADPGGRVIASVLPPAAVVLFEALMGWARRTARRGQEHPRLPLLRWVFDFSGTLAILRARVLEIPLPTKLAEAAEVVEASKPRGKRRAKKPAKPAAKTTPAPVPAAAASVPETVTDTVPESELETTQPWLRAVPTCDDGLEDMTRDELRDAATRYGVTVRGTKADVLARIRSTEMYAAERDGTPVTAGGVPDGFGSSTDQGDRAGNTADTRDGDVDDEAPSRVSVTV